MNQVNLMGRLARDPEIRYGGEKNTAVTSFSLAVPRAFKKNEADFIECTAFGRNAENISKYFSKGSRIFVTGSWTTGQYTNKDGVTIFTNKLNVNMFEFIDAKNQDNSDDDGFYQDNSDELPFD